MWSSLIYTNKLLNNLCTIVSLQSSTARKGGLFKLEIAGRSLLPALATINGVASAPLVSSSPPKAPTAVCIVLHFETNHKNWVFIITWATITRTQLIIFCKNKMVTLWKRFYLSIGETMTSSTLFKSWAARTWFLRLSTCCVIKRWWWQQGRYKSIKIQNRTEQR